jgi:hypothetical protein
MVNGERFYAEIIKESDELYTIKRPCVVDRVFATTVLLKEARVYQDEIPVESVRHRPTTVNRIITEAYLDFGCEEDTRDDPVAHWSYMEEQYPPKRCDKTPTISKDTSKPITPFALFILSEAALITFLFLINLTQRV